MFHDEFVSLDYKIFVCLPDKWMDSHTTGINLLNLNVGL